MNKKDRKYHNRSRGDVGMRTRQKQRIMIGVLCSVIIGLAVGYAVLSQQLNIN